MKNRFARYYLPPAITEELRQPIVAAGRSGATRIFTDRLEEILNRIHEGDLDLALTMIEEPASSALQPKLIPLI